MYRKKNYQILSPTILYGEFLSHPNQEFLIEFSIHLWRTKKSNTIEKDKLKKKIEIEIDWKRKTIVKFLKSWLWIQRF